MGEDYCPGSLRVLLWTFATAICQICQISTGNGRGVEKGTISALQFFSSFLIEDSVFQYLVIQVLVQFTMCLKIICEPVITNLGLFLMN